MPIERTLKVVLLKRLLRLYGGVQEGTISSNLFVVEHVPQSAAWELSRLGDYK